MTRAVMAVPIRRWRTRGFSRFMWPPGQVNRAQHRVWTSSAPPSTRGANGRGLFAQDVTRDGCLLHALQAAAVLLDGMARARDLACAGLAAQLSHQFEELADAGGAERMAFRLQAAGRVDRD